jgi:hypothetical protein
MKYRFTSETNGIEELFGLVLKKKFLTYTGKDHGNTNKGLGIRLISNRGSTEGRCQLDHDLWE